MYKFSRSQVSTARQTFYDKTRTCCISQRIRINHTCCQWEQKRCNQSLSRIRKNATKKKKHSFKPRREGEKLFCRIEAGLKLKAVTQTTRLILWKHWAKISAKSNTFQLFLKKKMFYCWLTEYTLAFARINLKVCVFLCRFGSNGQLRAPRCCWGGLELFCSDWLPALTAPHMIAGREARPLSLLLKEPFINYTSPAHSWVWTKSERGHGGEINSKRRWAVTDYALAFRVRSPGHGWWPATWICIYLAMLEVLMTWTDI